MQLLPKSEPVSGEGHGQGSSTFKSNSAAKAAAAAAASEGYTITEEASAQAATQGHDNSDETAGAAAAGSSQPLDIPGINKQFTKALFFLQSPKAMWKLLQSYSLPNLSPKLQQQQQQLPQKSRQLNATRSSKPAAAAAAPSAPESLDLSLLDGRSLVAALVWLIKYMDGHPVGNTHQKEEKQRGQQQEEGVEASSAHERANDGPSNTSNTGREAAGGKAGARPLTSRKVSPYEKQLVRKCAGALTKAADAYQQRKAHHRVSPATSTNEGQRCSSNSSNGSSSSSTHNSSSSSGGFTAPDMCSLVYSCAKLQQPRPRLVAAVAEELEPLLFACSVDELFR
jgi:hypothetical protein